jgi:hypothetical protein
MLRHVSASAGGHLQEHLLIFDVCNLCALLSGSNSIQYIHD